MTEAEIRQFELQKGLEMKAEELARDITKFFNSFDDENRFKLLSDNLLNEHRTLQQTTMKFMIHMMKEWAKSERYDGRNEATVKLCKKITEEFKDDLYLPMV